MITPLLQADAVVTKFISELIPHNAFFDYLFAFLSLHGNSIIVWGIIILLLVMFEEKKDRIFIFYFTASFFLTNFINNDLLKNIFRRPRPLPYLDAPLACPTNFAFPSGHAAVAFAAAVILAHFDAKRRWAYYAVASLIALSRIYLGCHYLLDVIGGAMVGALISLLVLQVHKSFGSKKEHITEKR